MQKNGKVDMTKGPILKQVTLFAVPIILGNILQQLYNTVDTLIIGNFCGSESLAAVGTSAYPVEILLCVFSGIGTGTSILVGQCTGNNNLSKLRKVVSTAIGFLYCCAIPISILGFLICPFILHIMQVPPEAFDLAVAYTRIVFCGTLGNMGYNMNAGILRGMGDSRSSLFFLIISCVVNIVLDLLLVVLLRMDTAGAALATAIAMVLSWIISIIYLKKKFPELEFSFLPKHIYKDELTSIIRIGLPLGLNSSLYSLGHIAMQTMSNTQGFLFMAAGSVANKVNNIANVAITGFASGATTFAAQNKGASNFLRLKKGNLNIALFSAGITAFLGILVTIFSPFLLRFFTPDPAVLELAVLRVRLVLPFMWTYAIFTTILHFVNGMGEIRYPTIINFLTLWAVRIPCAYMIVTYFNGYYLNLASTISFIFGMISMLCYYAFSPKWKEIKRLAAERSTPCNIIP